MVFFNRLVKIILIFIVSAFFSVGLCIFLIYKFAWYPTATSFLQEDSAGVVVQVSGYGALGMSDWWERDKKIIVKLHDWKNDGPLYRIVLPTDQPFISFNDTYILHSGERFTVAITPITALILHRIPKAIGNESVEKWVLPGRGFTVAPDESGIFVLSNDAEGKQFYLAKYDWNRKILFKISIPFSYDGLSKPIFFANNHKMAFKRLERDGPVVLYIWDLDNNSVQLITSEDNSEVAKNLNGELQTNVSGITIGVDENAIVEDHLYISNQNKTIFVQ